MGGNRTTSQELGSQDREAPSHVAEGRPTGCSYSLVASRMMVPVPAVEEKGLIFLMFPKSPEPLNAASAEGKQTGDTGLRHAEMFYRKGSHGAIVQSSFRQKE